MRAPGLKTIAAAFALGVASVGGYAPFGLYPLPVLTLALLLLITERMPRGAAGFFTGFAFGLGLFLGGVSWVYVSLHDFGAMPAPVAAVTTLLFCAFLALFPACAVFAAARITSPWLRRCLAFPGAWVFAEWVRGWVFTGFPWLNVGYSQAADSPLAGLAAIVGVYGVGLAVVLAAGLVAQMMARGRRIRLLEPAALAGLLIGSGLLKAVSWTEPAGTPISVSLLQGNVPQSMKWRPEQVRATLERYRSMVHASQARLVILPETALPMFLQEVPREFLDSIRDDARAKNTDVLIGVPELGGRGAYFNSVVSFGVSPTQAYRKSHLVPFGEFIPLRPLLAPIVNTLAIPLTDFSRGEASQRPLAVAGQRVAVNICYEDVFGEEIIRQLPEATLLVNVSNVAWFGDSIAPAQHLQIAQMRALETGRTMLRATNTGMTAVIDARGAVTAVAPTFQQASVDAEVQGMEGATPYVRLGNVPPIGLAVACILAAFGMNRRYRGD